MKSKKVRRPVALIAVVCWWITAGIFDFAFGLDHGGGMGEGGDMGDEGGGNEVIVDE